MSYRRVTMWVLDTASPEFKAEAQRRMKLVAEAEKDDPWLDAWMENQDTTGWVWDE